MSKASLLELCYGEKKYETFSISEYNEKLAFKLSNEEFSCKREQSQTCLAMPSAAENHLCVKCM